MKTLSLIYLTVICLQLNAQPAPPGSENPAPLEGLITLGLAGAAYGASKKYRTKKNH